MKKHSSDLKFCSCRQCRRGMRTRYGSWFVQYQRRRYRRKVKNALRTGNYSINSWAVGYTD